MSENFARLKEDEPHTPEEMILCLKGVCSKPDIILSGLAMDNGSGACMILSGYENTKFLNDLIDSVAIPLGVFAVDRKLDIISHSFKNPLWNKDQFREIASEIVMKKLKGKV